MWVVTGKAGGFVNENEGEEWTAREGEKSTNGWRQVHRVLLTAPVPLPPLLEEHVMFYCFSLLGFFDR